MKHNRGYSVSPAKAVATVSLLLLVPCAWQALCWIRNVPSEDERRGGCRLPKWVTGLKVFCKHHLWERWKLSEENRKGELRRGRALVGTSRRRGGLHPQAKDRSWTAQVQ